MKTYLLTCPVVDEDKISFEVARQHDRIKVNVDLRLLTEYLYAAIDDNLTDKTTLAYNSIVAKKV
jgi:hypothetical protein